ncbi:DUF2182 domain-containing protein [Marinobacter sp. SS21]|uniref:DUF2182 domain-containing protein n=1 Tax=Marinobacter sp. SS21 TaxID=2979460 RepID=UPI00232F9C6E|nr:DUF2182 domain-containing protein [Marinobacter sp. SS21]MDC0662786.1 DUF2182 domain-containing protein [Marinobacter sp. SS21]
MKTPHGQPQHLLSPDTATTLFALAAITALCWWYLVDLAIDMRHLPMSELMAFQTWTPAYFFMMFLMWAIMMVGMMVPSATPMILLYRRVARYNRVPHVALGTGLFVAGYLTAWFGFSLVATTAQWWLEELAVLTPMMKSQNVVFSGLVLILVGLYQWSPLKEACLRRCRGPLAFITQRWRPGVGGAWRMGLEHGGYCVGCCLLLMALLFVGGIMDLALIALIAVLVLLEKLLPGGPLLARALGSLAMALGVGLLVWG